VVRSTSIEISTMKLHLEIDQQQFLVHYKAAKNLAIPLNLNGEQPNHFGAPVATAHPLQQGEFKGDINLGGSCNVSEIALTPHCNGTHTESIAHITTEPLAPHDCLPHSLLLATLISVTPQRADAVQADYRPTLSPDDRLITGTLLAREIDKHTNKSNKQSKQSSAFFEAVIIRTQPNPTGKASYRYSAEHPPCFLSNCAIEYLLSLGVQHLLVDFPSIDKMHDEGQLSSHHLFWQVPATARQAPSDAHRTHTISELLYIDEEIDDGRYLLNLQITSLNSDASPSRPIIYPLESL